MVFDSCFGFDGVALSRAAADFSILSISLSLLISTKQFSRIRNYVEETFRKRAEDSEAFGKSQNKDDGIDHSNTSRNRLPPHFAESLPTGLILAGVTPATTKETFASLAKFLAKSDFHCALLQSKDVKTRKSGFGGGIGGGGMNSSSGGSTTICVFGGF